MLYIPEDIQLMILDYVPNKIDPIRPLSLCSKKFKNVLFSRLESLYWKKIESIFGYDNAQMMFSGLSCMKWGMILQTIHTDKDLILLEKGLKQMKNENRSFKVIDIRKALITDKAEFRFRDFWKNIVGNKQDDLIISRIKSVNKPGFKVRGRGWKSGTVTYEKVTYKGMEKIPNLIQRSGYSKIGAEPLIGKNYAWV